MNIAEELRALAAKYEATAATKQAILPRSDNPRPTMPLSENGEYFTANWWMEGYVGALAGVRLSDWVSENYGYGRTSSRPQHFRVLIPNAGQTHVSPADLGWMDATGYNPANYPDQEARTAAWIAVGCPTVGPGGKFDVRGEYITDAWKHVG